MPPISLAVSRRLVLAGLVSAPLLRPAAARAASQDAGLDVSAAIAHDADLVLIAVADVHSAYGVLPALVAQIGKLVAAAAPRPAAILINGDVFERGNVVAKNSEGIADWAALGALAAAAPVILNLGNHEIALRDDLATVVSGARRLGIEAIGNVIDRRTGKPFAAPATRLELGGLQVGVLGLSPADPAVWREAGRGVLELPDPQESFEAEAPAAFEGADLAVVLSHAGLAADKALLPAAPAGTLIVGGHDHLDLSHFEAETLLVHPGCWGDEIRVVSVRLGGEAPRLTEARVAVDPATGEDIAVKGVIAACIVAYSPPESQEVLTTSFPRMSRHDSILFAAEAVRAAAGADLALLNHSAFGAPLGPAPLSRYHLDNFVRFDGQVMVAEVDADTLAAILARANQGEGAPFERRTGDYLHAEAVAPEAGRSYRIAVSDWVAGRQATYLGVEGLEFAPVEGVKVAASVVGALRESD